MREKANILTLLIDAIIADKGCSPLTSWTIKPSPKSQKICLKKLRENFLK